MVGNQLLEDRIDLKLDLVKSFSEFSHVYERYGNQVVFNLITYDISCKQNYLQFYSVYFEAARFEWWRMVSQSPPHCRKIRNATLLLYLNGHIKNRTLKILVVTK